MTTQHQDTLKLQQQTDKNISSICLRYKQEQQNHIHPVFDTHRGRTHQEGGFRAEIPSISTIGIKPFIPLTPSSIIESTSFNLCNAVFAIQNKIKSTSFNLCNAVKRVYYVNMNKLQNFNLLLKKHDKHKTATIKLKSSTGNGAFSSSTGNGGALC